MNVFEAFPASSLEQWFIGQVKRATEVGTVFSNAQSIDVLVSDGNRIDFNRSPNPDVIVCDCLLYAKPEQLPAGNMKELSESFAIKDPDGKFYNIVQANPAKNQQTGDIEHIELYLSMTSMNIAEETANE